MAIFTVQQFSLIFHFWVFPFLIFPKRGYVFFFIFNFPAHSEGTITSPDKYLVDWRQSPVLNGHMQGVVALIVKVQQRTWHRDCHQSRRGLQKKINGCTIFLGVFQVAWTAATAWLVVIYCFTATCRLQWVTMIAITLCNRWSARHFMVNARPVY